MGLSRLVYQYWNNFLIYHPLKYQILSSWIHMTCELPQSTKPLKKKRETVELLKLVDFCRRDSISSADVELARDQRAFTPTPTQRPKLGVGVVWDLASPDREREKTRKRERETDERRREEASRVRSVARVR